ncbi:MAG TPA: hypothetical protein VGM37_02575 [Armatimonadota bacterium]
MGETRQTRDMPCAVHEERLDKIDEALKSIAETVRSLEKLADRALGGLTVLMIVQPVATGVLTGVILWYLTRKGR